MGLHIVWKRMWEMRGSVSHAVCVEWDLGVRISVLFMACAHTYIHTLFVCQKFGDIPVN